MRIMGLDYGAKTMGVAVSDELGLTAQGIETIRRERETKLRRTLARVDELAAEYGVERVVLGYPKHLDDTPDERTEKTLMLKERLERRMGLPVVLWDERLTTVMADNAMGEAGLNWSEKKEKVDMVAAAIILQGYLDSLSHGENKEL